LSYSGHLDVSKEVEVFLKVVVMSHDYLSTPMFPSNGEVLKNGQVSTIVQVLLNAQISNNVLVLKEVGQILKDSQVLMDTQVSSDGHVSTIENSGGWGGLGCHGT
jgi:hypothetical protein